MSDGRDEMGGHVAITVVVVFHLVITVEDRSQLFTTPKEPRNPYPSRKN